MMTPEDAVALVHRYAEAGSRRDIGALDGIFTEDFVNHHPAGPARGIQELKRFVEGVLDAWPELTVSVETAFANVSFEDGPRVGALVTLHGRNPERGRTLEVRELWIFRVSEGKLAERWYVVDQEGARVERI
ncbi:MAG: ester cyclase [Dehalococcoidia bacterium]